MNAAERRTAVLAILFLVLGWGARALPPSVCANCGDLKAVQEIKVPEYQSRTSSSPSEMIQVKGSPPEKSHRKGGMAGVRKNAGPVRINVATISELQKVKGIGPVMAKRIVEFREKHGPFRGAKDLDQVSGIGQKKLDNLLPLLIFD